MRCDGVKPEEPAAEKAQIPAFRQGTLSSREMRHSRGVAQPPLLSTIANGKLYANFNQINRCLRLPGIGHVDHGCL